MTPEEHDLLSRMDERLEFIHDKVTAFCTFKDSAAIDIANLKSQCDNQKDIPRRVSFLEKSIWTLSGAFALFVLLIGWNWIIIGGAK